MLPVIGCSEKAPKRLQTLRFWLQIGPIGPFSEFSLYFSLFSGKSEAETGSRGTGSTANTICGGYCSGCFRKSLDGPYRCDDALCPMVHPASRPAAASRDRYSPARAVLLCL